MPVGDFGAWFGRCSFGEACIASRTAAWVCAERLRLNEDNGVLLDGYRFDSLEYVFGMAETTS